MLRVVALDGHRVAMRTITLREQVPEAKRVVIPGKTLSEVSKILPGDDEDVELFFTENHVIFEFEKTTVVSRLIEGEFLSIDQMNLDYTTKIRINRLDLISCVDRASLMANEGDKKPIILEVTDDTLELKINSFIGSMDEKIDIEKEGKDIIIAFNPRFILDALRVIDDEEVTLYMINPKAPCFIRDEDSTYLYLILPINFN